MIVFDEEIFSAHRMKISFFFQLAVDQYLYSFGS